MITLEETKSDPLLRLLPATVPQQELDKLPSFITAADIRELIHYLQRRPAGVMVAEELDRPRKRLFEDRKVDAYQFLGITTREGQTLKLTIQGRKLGRSLEHDTEGFRVLLESYGPYINALDWISQQNIDMVTATELSTFWHGRNVEAFAFAEQEAIRSSAVSFFNLCQAASLGTMTLGKRGHITRLFVDREELGKFLTGNTGQELQSNSQHAAVSGPSFEAMKTIQENHVASDPFTVLIKCDLPRLEDLLHRTIAMAGLRSRTLQVFPEKGFGANAGVSSPENCALLTVLGEDSFVKENDEKDFIRDRILIELGAAQVHYDRRVIILSCAKGVRCEGLRDLIWHDIEGEGLSWETGLQLVETLREFRENVSSATLRESMM
jgi:hypothetical protein